MIKQKQKYNTKKRKQERLKWQIIIISFLVASGFILVRMNGAMTEIALAETPDVNIERVEDNRTLKQHVWDLLTEEGGLSFDEAITGMAIVNCESRWDKYAIGVNKDGSKDLGLWQISEKYHGSKISREESFDVYASTRYAIKLYRDWGNSWQAWTCSKYI